MARAERAPLRRGWTTGACAAAAARAAFAALVTGRFPDPVTIRLPRGEGHSFALALAELGDGTARAGIVKDAGDDPDVTHGALIIAELAWAEPGSGVRFRAGAGVGTVTRPGLPLAVGEPAINPAPRAMIQRRARRCRRGEWRAAARCHRDDRDPRRRAPRRADDERKARHRRRAVGAGHHRDRRALFLFVVDPRDPPRHRRRPRRRSRPYRRGDRHDLGARGATALPSARARADRHGRFCRRHAQISAPPSGRAADPGRRLRQARQARRRPSRSAFEPQPGRWRRRSRACSPGSAPTRRPSPPRQAATAPRKFSRSPASDGTRLPRRWRARRAKWRWRRSAADTLVEVAIVDRAGDFLALVGAEPAS